MDLYQLVVYALIAGFVAVFWKAAQWTLASTKAARASESLTPADLEALQEACEGLITDLRAAADESTARVAQAIERAEIVCRHLSDSVPMDRILVAGDAPAATPAAQPEPASQPVAALPEDPIKRIYHFADTGMDHTEIAARENRSPGEVKLILDLRELQADTV